MPPADAPPTSDALINDEPLTNPSACERIDSRTDGAPGWCNEYSSETACKQHFILDIHQRPHPCVWLDVGCHASNAVACGPDGNRQERIDGSGTGYASVALALLVVALVAGAAFFFWRHFHERLVRIGLPETPRRVKPVMEPRDEDEVGELLEEGDDIDAGDAGPSLAVAAEMSAEAARSAAVACAAAHALLASHTTEANQSDGSIAKTDHTLQLSDAECGSAVIEDNAARAGDSAPQLPVLLPAGCSSANTEFVSSPRLADPEMPAINLSKQRAIFDSGDLFDSPAAASPSRDTTSQPRAVATVTDKSDAEADDDEEDGYNARPSSAAQYVASKQNLAMSLD